jgi:sulfatase maturation enzyme AslB (radical SAM superfamily)
MLDLSKVRLLSFEIGPDCNLSAHHPNCPINKRTPKGSDPINIEDIVRIYNEAKSLNLNGSVAFHFYNEPLLYLDSILAIMEKLRDAKFLLWTNGTLLKNSIEENHFLSRFNVVVISLYFKELLPKFKLLQKHYKNIHIVNQALDSRVEIYQKKRKNILGCVRPVWEIPIDHWGNICLCCMDWEGSHSIGNIKKSSLKEVLQSRQYQNTVGSIYRHLLAKGSPLICKHCIKPFPLFAFWVQWFYDYQLNKKKVND